MERKSDRVCACEYRDRLKDKYRVSGFCPRSTIWECSVIPRLGSFDLPVGEKNELRSLLSGFIGPSTTIGCGGFEFFSCGDTRIYLEIAIRRVLCRTCGKVKQEKLSWLADNPFYTQALCFFRGATLPGFHHPRCG